MKRAQHVQGFLDLEAAVDKDDEVMSDEEDEMDRQEMFIYDDVDSEEEESPNPPRPFTDTREQDDVRLTEAYDALLERVLGPSRYAPIEHYPTWAPTDEQADQVEHLLRHPAIEDSPLYRVACKIGREEMIVMNLLHAAKPIHQLRSAFTPGHIRGYVYLECTMNRHLISLLSTTPGISRTRQGLTYQAIDLDDRPKLLVLPKDSRSVGVGQWVQVLKGLYKGDVGIVAGTHSWGVHLLVVPRLSYTTDDPKGKGKRKASTVRPDPKLFDPEEFQKTTSVQIHAREGHLFVGRLEFMDGLLYKRFAYSSLSGRVFQMPWSLSSMFALALNHHASVDLNKRPRPQEWIFYEEEEVVVRSSGKLGVIRSLEAENAEVEYKDEGTQPVHWYDMRKNIKHGHFVTILNGPSQGYQGWVIERTGDIAKVADKIVTTGDASTNEPIEIQVNRLRIIDTPFHFAQEPTHDDIPIQKIFRHPWCNTEVLISKLGHPRKGDPATIIAVLDDTTGIRLQVQFSRYNPNLPYDKLTLDCEDVVETSTRMGLKAYFNVQDPRRRTDAAMEHRSTEVTIPTGGTTPMPTETSSTPAWDPSSRTPLAFEHGLSQLSPTRVEASQSSRTLVTPPAPQHVLLIPQLVGASVKVFINGGQYTNKLADVVIRCVNGRLGMFHLRNKTYHPLEPDWVTPKIPSPANDHGLLMVIQGEHCGKYVRRINHMRRQEGVVMILAVVHHALNSQDTLTGEQLILSPDLLCKVAESASDKQLNKNVMTTIRQEFKS